MCMCLLVVCVVCAYGYNEDGLAELSKLSTTKLISWYDPAKSEKVICFLFLVTFKVKTCIKCSAETPSPVRWRCTLHNVMLPLTEARVGVFFFAFFVAVTKKSRNFESKATNPAAMVLPSTALTLGKLSLARRKISICSQHTSLSLVKFWDYTIIHPTQEAEEETWAGETAFTTLYGHSFVSCLFLCRIGRAVHDPAYADPWTGLCFVALCATAIFFFLFVACPKSCRCCCRLLLMGDWCLALLVSLRD